MPMAVAESSTRGLRSSPAIASARSAVPRHRLSRIRRRRAWVQRPDATFSPARWTTASQPSRPAASIRPAIGSQPISPLPGWRRTTRSTVWPPLARKAPSPRPMSPLAPVIATRSGLWPANRAWAARSRGSNAWRYANSRSTRRRSNHRPAAVPSVPYRDWYSTLSVTTQLDSPSGAMVEVRPQRSTAPTRSHGGVSRSDAPGRACHWRTASAENGILLARSTAAKGWPGTVGRLSERLPGG